MAICMHGQDVGHGIVNVWFQYLTKGVPAPGLAQFDREHFFLGGTDRDLLLLEQRRWAMVWTIAFRFAERDFRLRVNRNFDTIFDSVFPQPYRTFGLLNLSLKLLALFVQLPFSSLSCAGSSWLPLPPVVSACFFRSFSLSSMSKTTLLTIHNGGAYNKENTDYGMDTH